MDNGTVCAAFWRHVNLRGDDRIFPCCRFKTPVSNFSGDLVSVLSTKEYQRLRDQSSAGIPLDGCSKCYHEERMDKHSLRQQFNSAYDTSTVELEYLEIGFDNICNLTCDGCWDEFSSAWAGKNNPTTPLRKLITHTTEIKVIPDTLRKILFLGGEPLMTNRHKKLLELIKHKHLVSVTYNTNGTFLLDDKTVHLLSEFKKADFIVSIDGVGALNDRVRSGSLWTDIIEFINTVKTQNFDIRVHTTIHKNNWHGLKELAEFIKDMNLTWTTNVLTYPKHLDIMYLEDKAALRQLLTQVDIPNKGYILNHIGETTNV